jgi:hypothetical protein
MRRGQAEPPKLWMYWPCCWHHDVLRAATQPAYPEQHLRMASYRRPSELANGRNFERGATRRPVVVRTSPSVPVVVDPKPYTAQVAAAVLQ